MPDPVAGERTWTIYECSKCGARQRDGCKCPDWPEFVPVEVVELSRLRAAEEEQKETRDYLKDKLHRTRVERDRLAGALRQIRHRAERGSVIADVAREALASLEQKED